MPRRAIVTDDAHTKAAPLAEATREAVAREIVPRVAEGRVPVLGGFVGATLQGVTTTLGRGGSDYSAAIIGAALDAREIQIWTDVDGMMTADPRIVAGPRVVPHLSFGEASELAYFGAKVLHPSTILPAVAKDIPVRILNSRRAGRQRHADHGRPARGGPGARGRRVQAPRHDGGDHVDADAHGARLPAPRVRGLRAPSHGRRRRDDLRGQRLGDGRRRRAAGRRSSRTCASSPKSPSRPTSRFCAPSATICATIRASPRASSARSRGSPCAWSRRRRHGATSRSSCATRISAMGMAQLHREFFERLSQTVRASGLPDLRVDLPGGSE